MGTNVTVANDVQLAVYEVDDSVRKVGEFYEPSIPS